MPDNYVYPWLAYYYYPGIVKMLDFYFFYPEDLKTGLNSIEREIDNELLGARQVFVSEEAINRTKQNPVFWGHAVPESANLFDRYQLQDTGCAYQFPGRSAAKIFEILGK